MTFLVDVQKKWHLKATSRIFYLFLIQNSFCTLIKRSHDGSASGDDNICFIKYE